MNLRDLEYLVAVDEHRHFGRAAEACHVSQPTLSTQLKKLEAELGVDLIERNPRHVLLTGAGEQVREVAQSISAPESASIRMGLVPTLGP